MDWAALITWILTAGGGFVLLATWLKGGGMKQQERGRIRPVIILSHFTLAASGLVLWFVYVLSDRKSIAWIAFVLLLIVAAIGFAMLGIWLTQRRSDGGQVSEASRSRPAEQGFASAIVGMHGVLAATTLVLVFLATIGVGS